MTSPYHIANFDFPNHRFVVDGAEVRLTALEAKYLSYLIENAHRVLRHEELVTAIHGSQFVYSGTVAKRIQVIRRKLGDDAWIKTVHGVGYRWMELRTPGLHEALAPARPNSPLTHDLSLQAKEFLGGGPTTMGHIAADLDISRTQYVAGENGWRQQILGALGSVAPGLQLILLLGPAGAGKTTLGYRMLRDWIRHGGAGTDSIAGHTSLPSLLELSAHKSSRQFCAVRLTYPSDSDEVNGLIKWVREISKSEIPITLLLVADTNKWRQIEDRFRTHTRLAVSAYTTWTLSHVLDGVEISELISRLRQYDALRQRAHLTDDELAELFRRRATRGLLTCLIEVTRGSDERETLSDILLSEYEALPERAQLVHLVVSISSSRQMGVDSSVLVTISEQRSINGWYFGSPAFLNELALVVIRDRSGNWRSRHPLLANVLVKAVGKRYGVTLERAVISLLIASSEDAPVAFLTLARRAVFDVVTNQDAVEQVVVKVGRQLTSSYHATTLLNQLGKALMGRRRASRAERILEVSLEREPAPSNPATYLMGYAHLGTGDIDSAVAVAQDVLRRRLNVEHVYQATQVLVGAHDVVGAKQGLEILRSMVTDSELDTEDLADLEGKIGALEANSDSRPLRPTERLHRLLEIARSSGLDASVITSIGQLLDEDPNFPTLVERVSSFALALSHEGSGHDQAGQTQALLEAEWRRFITQHESQDRKVPRTTLSRLLASAARLRLERATAIPLRPEEAVAIRNDYAKAIGLDPHNVWAKLWFSGFLHGQGKYDLALDLAREAFGNSPENPVTHVALISRLVERPDTDKDAASEAVLLADNLLGGAVRLRPRLPSTTPHDDKEPRWIQIALALRAKAQAVLAQP